MITVQVIYVCVPPPVCRLACLCMRLLVPMFVSFLPSCLASFFHAFMHSFIDLPPSICLLVGQSVGVLPDFILISSHLPLLACEAGDHEIMRKSNQLFPTCCQQRCSHHEAFPWLHNFHLKEYILQIALASHPVVLL